MSVATTRAINADAETAARVAKYLKAVRELRETEAAVKAAGVDPLSLHPLAGAIAAAQCNLIFADGTLWSTVRRHGSLAVIHAHGHRVRFERTGDYRPKLVVEPIDETL